jgi:hypothetical protein
MDFAERARVRLTHWMNHNDNHQEEYQKFALELEEAGAQESARQLREMAELSRKSNDCLRKALEALEE